MVMSSLASLHGGPGGPGGGVVIVGGVVVGGVVVGGPSSPPCSLLSSVGEIIIISDGVVESIIGIEGIKEIEGLEEGLWEGPISVGIFERLGASDRRSEGKFVGMIERLGDSDGLSVGRSVGGAWNSIGNVDVYHLFTPLLFCSTTITSSEADCASSASRVTLISSSPLFRSLCPTPSTPDGQFLPNIGNSCALGDCVGVNENESSTSSFITNPLIFGLPVADIFKVYVVDAYKLLVEPVDSSLELQSSMHTL